jgi:hypothetical protein
MLTGWCASTPSTSAGTRAARRIFKIILDDRDLATGQLYFPDSISGQVYAAHSPYRERKQERDTVNANDFIFLEQNGAGTLADTEEAGGAYRATLVIGINRAREDRT